MKIAVLVLPEKKAKHRLYSHSTNFLNTLQDTSLNGFMFSRFHENPSNLSVFRICSRQAVGTPTSSA
jgi:hypothetical protein